MRDAPTISRQPARPLFLVLGLAIAAGLVLAVFLIWILRAQSGTAEFLGARPAATLAALKTLLGDGKIWHATASTLGTWVVGFGVAAAVGLPLCLMLARRRGLDTVIWPSLLVIAAIPGPLLVMLFVIWEGIDSRSGGQTVSGLVAFVAIVAIGSQARGDGDAAAAWAGALRGLAVGAALALSVVVFTETMASPPNRLGQISFQAFTALEIPRAFALAIYVWLLAFIAALPFAIASWIVGRR